MQVAASEPGTAVFADQFENAANFRAHLRTGEEIWQQTGGHLHAFVSGAGTGGTIAGVSHQLKSRSPSVKVRVTSQVLHSTCEEAHACLWYPAILLAIAFWGGHLCQTCPCEGQLAASNLP